MLESNLGIRKRSSSIIFPIIGVIIITIFLGLIWFWESHGRELWLYDEVLVLKENVVQGTTIQENMLDIIKIEADKIIDNPIKNPNEIIGMKSKHFIPKNAQIHMYYFDQPDMILNDNQFIAKIPQSWIEAVPETIRRKDKAVLYAVNSETIKEIHTFVPKDKYQEISVFDETEETFIRQTLDKPVLSTTVAYVKDSSNHEIITISQQDRIDGSSTVSQVEVVLTMNQLKTLEGHINNGSKFVIMYQGNEKDG